MNKVHLEANNKAPNFIGSWIIEPPAICDELIDYFETRKDKQKTGISGAGKNLEIKDRLDISLKPRQIEVVGNEILKQYMDQLYACYLDYLEQWPFLAGLAEYLEIGNFNIGRYEKGQHFQQLHTERSSLRTLHRVLAWMTYLNDVDNGGETYFSHYDLNIRPKKGLTLIWPAEWTHAHKGNIVTGDPKYMITGWLTFSAKT